MQLAGESIAEVQAKRGTTQLSAPEKNQIEAALTARQNAIKPAIQSLGGEVRSDYQNASANATGGDPPRDGTSVRIAGHPSRHRWVG